MEQDFDGCETEKSNVNDIDGKKASKDVKGLLRSVFSTGSLAKSLQKLNDLGRNSSPQAKSFKVVQTPIKLSSSSSLSRLNVTGNRSLGSSQVMRQSQI